TFLRLNLSAPPAIYTLSLHDALPISARSESAGEPARITLCRVARDAGGVALERLPPLPIATDIPHARLLLDDAVAQMLPGDGWRSEEHTSELQSRENLVCRLLLEKKK